MTKVIDMVGFRAGKLKVIGPAGVNKHGVSLWQCECLCGNRPAPIEGAKLRSGRRKSCGCIKRDYRPSLAPKPGRGVHRFVRRIWDEMAAQQVTQQDICKRATMSRSILRHVRDGVSRPYLDDVEALLNILGWELELRRSE